MVAVLGGPRWKAIYHVPLPLALSLEEQAGSCVHELASLPPPSQPSLSLWGSDTQQWNMGIRECKSIKYTFTLSIT